MCIKCYEMQESCRPDRKHAGNRRTFPANRQVDISNFRHLIKPKVGGGGLLKTFFEALSLPFQSRLSPPSFFSLALVFAPPLLPRAWNRLVHEFHHTAKHQEESQKDKRVILTPVTGVHKCDDTIKSCYD